MTIGRGGSDMKKWLMAFGLFLFGVAPALGQQYVAGKDYDVIAPALRTGGGGKIEVVEFFAYSCSHCYNFEPLVVGWKGKLDDDIAFSGSPAVWGNSPDMELHARAYYTAKALDALDKVHGAIFAAIHIDRKRLASEGEIRSLFEASGIATKDFDRAFNSFGVKHQVRQAITRQTGARITGTPEMMVAGKYRITTRKAGSQADMLKIIDYLIERERAAANKKEKKEKAQ